MSIIGMWQRRMAAIIDHIRHRLLRTEHILQPDFIYIDNPIALFNIGKSAQNNLTLADVIKPFLEKRQFSIILEATPSTWQKAQQLNRRFTELFEVIRISPSSQTDAIKQYQAHRIKLEMEKNLKFTNEALQILWQHHTQHHSEQVLPGLVITPLQQIATRYQNTEINAAIIWQEIKAQHHLRDHLSNPEITLNREEVLAHFQAHLVGQKNVCEILTNTVLNLKAKLSDPKKPNATLLFIGPTGVGKTEAAKALANYLFNDERCLVRFDMNEYMDTNAAGRLIGEAWQPEGLLTQRIRYQPFSILLLDEIEKAHADVHDLLLQLLGEGRLTDYQGRTTNFRECIIILTSNLGAENAYKKIGFQQNSTPHASHYQQAVENFFRPEFINRLDEIVAFSSLSLEEAKILALRQMKNLLVRDGFIRRTTFFNINQETLTLLAEFAYDPKLGGRAIKRLLEKELMHRAAKTLANSDGENPILIEFFNETQNNLNQPTKISIHLQELVLAKNIAHNKHQPAFSTTPNWDILHKQVEKLIDNLAVYRERFNPTTYPLLWHLNAELDTLKEVMTEYLWQDEEKMIDLHKPTIRRKPEKIQYRNFAMCASPDFNVKELFAQHDIHDFFASQAKETFVIDQQQNVVTELKRLTAQTNSLPNLHTIKEHHSINPNYCVIRLTCCIEHQGKDTLAKWQTLYTEAINSMQGLIITSDISTQSAWILAQGLGLNTFFENEKGIHLIHHDVQLPYQFACFEVDETSINSNKLWQKWFNEHEYHKQEIRTRITHPNIIRFIKWHLNEQKQAQSISITDWETGIYFHEKHIPQKPYLSDNQWQTLLLQRLDN